MAISTAPLILYSFIFLFLLLTSIATAAETEAASSTDIAVDDTEFVTIIRSPSGKATGFNLHFYFHEIFGTTSNVVASQKNSSTDFGNFSVFDDPLRVGIDPNSRQIGWAQGFDATMNDSSITIALNFVFTAGPYKGSELALYGRVNSTYIAERTVIGGTNQFRMARGYAISKPAPYPDIPNYIVIEFDVYIKCDSFFMEDDE